jgi:hypothetical protein
MAPFGVITECNSPDFNGVDGILGFGLPKPGYEGRTLPTPILFALTEKGIADSNAQVRAPEPARPCPGQACLPAPPPRPAHVPAAGDRPRRWRRAQELQRKFSFFSTDDKAEVQLGGYDPATCDDEMDYTPSLSPTDFIVGVTSLKFGHPGSEGHQELLKFNECVPDPPRSKRPPQRPLQGRVRRAGADARGAAARPAASTSRRSWTQGPRVW